LDSLSEALKYFIEKNKFENAHFWRRDALTAQEATEIPAESV